MADGGELKAIFKGAQEDMAQAVESAAGKMATFGDTTAQNVRDSVAAIQNADGANADAIKGIRNGLEGDGAGTVASSEPGDRLSRLRRMLNGNPAKAAEDDDLPPGNEPISAENGSQRLFKRLFPKLADVNGPRYEQGPEWQRNCQSCVNAVDHTLDGAPASAVPRRAAFPWPDSVTKTIGGGKRFVGVKSYDDITDRMTKAGDGARGVVWGRRVRQIGTRTIEGEGHVFNVVNRGGRVFYVDGQTGTFAKLENFSHLYLLRTK